MVCVVLTMIPSFRRRSISPIMLQAYRRRPLLQMPLLSMNYFKQPSSLKGCLIFSTTQYRASAEIIHPVHSPRLWERNRTHGVMRFVIFRISQEEWGVQSCVRLSQCIVRSWGTDMTVVKGRKIVSLSCTQHIYG